MEIGSIIDNVIFVECFTLAVWGFWMYAFITLTVTKRIAEALLDLDLENIIPVQSETKIGKVEEIAFLIACCALSSLILLAIAFLWPVIVPLLKVAKVKGFESLNPVWYLQG